MMLIPMILVFSLFIVLPLSVFAQSSNGSVAVGASLTAGQNSSSWLSPSEDFAFGFRDLQNNTNLFLLSIWFAKIPDKTIVWCANDGQPVTRGSTLNLTADSGLVLTGPQGQELWKSEPILDVVASAVMSDYGNFALHATNNSDTLWETFRNPTDTILPGQTIDRDGFLYSRQSETNFSKGRFQLKLQQDGNLALYTVNLPTDNPNSPYYESSTTTGTVPGSEGLQLVFNTSGALYVLRENNGRFFPKEADQFSSTDNYFRAILNYDGVFTKYYYPESGNASNWTPIWSIPNDICLSLRVDAGLGVCGYNSICTLRLDQRPTCGCPSGFSLMNPNDVYGDCKPDFPQGCAEDELLLPINSSTSPGSRSSPAEDLYRVEVLLNTDWPTSDYIMLKPLNGESCRESCLQDCMCAVAIFREGTCWKKKLPLSNGRVDSRLNSQAFIKVRKDNVTLAPASPFPSIPDKEKEKRKNQDTLILVGSLLLGSSVLFNALLVGANCMGFFPRNYHKKHKTTAPLQRAVQINLNSFTYSELEEATNGFEEQLGKGAFGVVYKGVLQTGSGSVAVAVKKLHCVVEDSEKEFKNEVKTIGQTHHKNLVRLLGYCNEGQHRLLVYEFLSNGTLSNYLFGEIKPTWGQRIEIAYGIARGILYLHEECSSQIIHCDIKPQNIILDENNTARISDFGLSKLLMMDQSQTHTAIRGTKGYVAPEWFRNLPITAKVDVYSFGVVLLEIICCRKSVDSENQSGEEKGILTDWAYDCYQEGALDMLVNCDENLENKKQLQAFVMVALWCIQENPNIRPTMRKVVQMLEGVVEVLAPPCPSPYSTTTIIPIPS